MNVSLGQGKIEGVEETPADGNLPAALDKLHAAIAAVTDPIKEFVDGVMMIAPCLYEQLLQDIPARMGEGAGRGSSRSLPPAYLDALELRRDIDETVRKWCRASSPTPELLRRLASSRFRPQDVAMLERITVDLERWSVSIRSLLYPEHVKTVSAPCPACAATHIYRQKNGEQVRQAALQIIAAEGCTCLNCGAFWAPSSYLLLASVLGYAPPAGVDQMTTEEVA